MKLEKFKEQDNKRKFIIIFTVCCVFLLAGVFLYTSFAVFTEEKQFNVINGTYQDPGDLYFAVYIDGQITNTFPSKDSGYTLDTTQSSCTNGATVSWDNASWSAAVNFSNYSAGNMSRTKCTMYFKEATFADTILACNDTAANCIKDNASLSKEIATDDPDNNARYIGANPNNYVSFNGELWRIIGVFNNINDGNGNEETRLKIIRAEPIGTYSWDNKGGSGENDWSDSALQQVLNSGAYYNRTSGECPYGLNGATTSCDFSTTGLTSEAKSMIGNAKWNLGGTANYTSSSNGLTSHFYGYERGTTVYTGRPAEWIGQIGLMYPSDYGYATSGGSSMNRASCLAKELYNWYSSSYSDCKNNDWLYKSGTTQWTLTPSSDNSVNVFNVLSSGNVSNRGLANVSNRAVSPALYLSSNVKISGGDGSEKSPFELSL
ncbi:TPA: hypothetical protein IAB95_03405 [Candidatus Ventrenecus avicola]|nr:hypothetical protein [Candidatus Ventrenecus avicola]